MSFFMDPNLIEIQIIKRSTFLNNQITDLGVASPNISTTFCYIPSYLTHLALKRFDSNCTRHSRILVAQSNHSHTLKSNQIN